MKIFGLVFDRPVWLLALALLPVLVGFFALALRARRQALVRLLGETSRDRLTTMAGRDRRAIEASLAVLTAALVITALAGPRWGEVKNKIERTGVDVAILLDVSRSMLAQDVQPSRLDRARREVRGLLEAANGSRVALVTYAGEARVLCPFTLDHDTISLFLDDVDPTVGHAGGSDIATGLLVAGEALSGASGKGKAIVILTDGEDPKGGGSYAASEAASLAARGVRVHVIGLGTKDGAKIPVLDKNDRPGFFRDEQNKEVVTKLDAEVLGSVARAGRGDYLDAATTAFPMDELWRKRISLMERSSTGSEDYESLQPRFQWFLFAALITASGWWLAPLGIAVRKRREARLRGLAWGRAAAILLILIPMRSLAGPADDGRRGDELYEKGDYAAAAAAYEASTRSALSEWGTHNLGNARYREGKFGAAAKSWSDAQHLATDPESRRNAAYNRGVALMKQAEGDETLAVPLLGEAIESFNTALGVDPSDQEAHHNRAIAIAQWVAAQRKAQKGGKPGSPDGQGEKQKADEQNVEKKDSKSGEKGDQDGSKAKPAGTPASGKPQGDEQEPSDELGTAEMERLDRVTDQREKEQQRLHRLRSQMRRQPGEKDW